MPSSRVLVLMSQEARARARAERERAIRGRSQREILQDSLLARQHARLQSMPVIEQAKGIIMSGARCGPDEAFDMLRQASQRANVKLHALAAGVVQQVASSRHGNNVTPIAMRQAARRPAVPAPGYASAHEQVAAVHDQAAVMHERAAAFYDHLGRADEAAHERNLAEDERTKATQARRTARGHGED